MTKRTKIMVASLALVVLLAISFAGVALADDPNNPSDNNVPYAHCWEMPGLGHPHWLGGIWSQAVSELLGLTPEEIQAQLYEGKSLAEIAAVQGVDEETLVGVILSAKQEFLQQRVEAGVLTQEQADLMLERMEARVREMVNGNNLGSFAGGAHCGYGGAGQGTGTGYGMMGYRGNGDGQPSYRNGVRFGGGPGGMMGGWGRGWR